MSGSLIKASHISSPLLVYMNRHARQSVKSPFPLPDSLLTCGLWLGYLRTCGYDDESILSELFLELVVVFKLVVAAATFPSCESSDRCSMADSPPRPGWGDRGHPAARFQPHLWLGMKGPEKDNKLMSHSI